MVQLHQFQGRAVDGVAALVILIRALSLGLHDGEGRVYSGLVVLVRELADLIHAL